MEEQADKMPAIKEKATCIETIIYDNSRRLHNYTQPLPFEDFSGE